jgi:hypothetical protein
MQSNSYAHAMTIRVPSTMIFARPTCILLAFKPAFNLHFKLAFKPTFNLHLNLHF